jgi:hypothetical protein
LADENKKNEVLQECRSVRGQILER